MDDEWTKCVWPFQNSWVAFLSPNMMISESEESGRRLGPQGTALMNGIGVLINKVPRELFCSLL
jgi:hypothetical protein